MNRATAFNRIECICAALDARRLLCNIDLSGRDSIFFPISRLTLLSLPLIVSVFCCCLAIVLEHQGECCMQQCKNMNEENMNRMRN